MRSIIVIALLLVSISGFAVPSVTISPTLWTDIAGVPRNDDGNVKTLAIEYSDTFVKTAPSYNWEDDNTFYWDSPADFPLGVVAQIGTSGFSGSVTVVLLWREEGDNYAQELGNRTEPLYNGTRYYSMVDLTPGSWFAYFRYRYIVRVYDGTTLIDELVSGLITLTTTPPTPSPTRTPTVTPYPSATPVPTATNTFTPTPTATNTFTPTPTATRTWTPTSTPTVTPTYAATVPISGNLTASLYADIGNGSVSGIQDFTETFRGAITLTEYYAADTLYTQNDYDTPEGDGTFELYTSISYNVQNGASTPKSYQVFCIVLENGVEKNQFVAEQRTLNSGVGTGVVRRSIRMRFPAAKVGNTIAFKWFLNCDDNKTATTHTIALVASGPTPTPTSTPFSSVRVSIDYLAIGDDSIGAEYYLHGNGSALPLTFSVAQAPTGNGWYTGLYAQDRPTDGMYRLYIAYGYTVQTQGNASVVPVQLTLNAYIGDYPYNFVGGMVTDSFFGLYPEGILFPQYYAKFFAQN